MPEVQVSPSPETRVCHVGRKVVIHWPTFEAAVLTAEAAVALKPASRK